LQQSPELGDGRLGAARQNYRGLASQGKHKILSFPGSDTQDAVKIPGSICH